MDYLNELRSPNFRTVQDLYPVPDGPQSFLDDKYLIKLFRYRALKAVMDMGEAF